MALSTEIVARSVVFPTHLADELSEEKYVSFQEIESAEPIYCEYGFSVAIYAPGTDNDVHQFGCRLAATQNMNRPLKATAFAHASLPVARYYLGFYSFQADEINGDCGSYSKLSVVHAPENGEYLHCNVLLRMPSELERDKIKIEKVTARARIWRALQGPRRYVCECDAVHASELAKISLHVRP